MTWTSEQRRKYHLTPYVLETGEVVVEELAFSGICSACKQRMVITVGIDRPATALLRRNSGYRIVFSDYDKHPCKAQPYRLKRPYNPQIDMAHPVHNPHFISDLSLYDEGVR